MAGGDVMNHDALMAEQGFPCKSTTYVSEFCNTKTIVDSSVYIESYYDHTTKYNEDTLEDYHLNLAPDSHRSSEPSSSLSVSSKTGSSRQIHYINPAIFIERYDSDSNLCYDSETEDGTNIEKNTYRKEQNRNVANQKVINRQQFQNRVVTKSSTHSDLSTDENTKRSRGSRCMTFEEWLAHKQQLKQKERKTVSAKEDEMEKQRRLEEQREDFKRWLAAKKEQEIRRKKEAKLNELKAKQEEELLEQKMMEKEYLLREWIRRKAEQAKEKKRREEEAQRQIEELKKERKERGAKAFEQWVKKSKYKSRPVPLNMGLESLKGSVSAMFVNPTPWQENIDVRQSSLA